jgi:hypothetical protein
LDASTRKMDELATDQSVSFPSANNQGQAGHFAPPCWLCATMSGRRGVPDEQLWQKEDARILKMVNM